MRTSQGLFVTWRDAPADAETRGIRALSRAGFVKKVGAGLYAHLPLMTRVMARLETLLRRELEGAAQEVDFPLLQPQALWQQSGRWDAYTRAEGIMFTVTDRAGRAHALGPTHEELAASVVGDVARSYRDLPLCVYQIGRKFRDELRPRAGLLRTQEFVMKDAYSFHTTPDDLAAQFCAMSDVYARVLTRLGVPWRAVEADSGSIGGTGSREFMLLSDVGEDEVLYSPDGQYAANAERAVGRAADPGPSPFAGATRRRTPDAGTVEAACAALGCAPGHMVKNVLLLATFARPDADDRVPVLVSVRGDDSVNTVKVWNAVQERAGQVGGGTLLRLDAAGPDIWADPAAVPLGYVAPDLPDEVLARQDTLHPDFLRLCDREAAALRDFATGANETGWHVTGANWHAQYRLPDIVDLRQARAGDACRHDPAQHLQAARAIEVGHVFQLGTRYTDALNITVSGPDGTPQPVFMGCYGLGVTRLVQAVAEVHNDERGLVWPEIIAPYHVVLTVVNMQDAAQAQAAGQLYADLRAAGVDVLLDDRDERPGVKFADAELWGIPWRVTIGRALDRGEVEIQERTSGHVETMPIRDAVTWLGERGT
ncbi:prolyl-tRNA synthetase [Deinococcus metalli]|uniref:Proline--tRNA ligase n=1 Tax=Deinococcus metalli TaxID=1141878 RepID=A0A7W8NPF0_9DEIO|nr:proline--tRNA ligase [Deinococcus metalli]MBB5377914.1 prolyl-tRNA synthetase [Deinococcus metalli]GHF55139.1 proline--tRNA ligase [Deinococcus metalli]